MNSAMITLVSLSVSGSILALVLFAGKPLLKNTVSKAFSYYIWLLVLLRLVIPVAVPVNAMGMLFGIGQPGVSVAPIKQTGIPVGDQTGQTVVPANTQAVLQENNEAVHTQTPSDTQWSLDMWKLIQNNLLWIWLAGAAVSLGWYVTAYIYFLRRIRRSCDMPHQKDLAVFEQMRVGKRIDMACSSLVSTPVLIGAFYPVIVLPQLAYVSNGMDEELKYILRHELTHFRRKDVLYKWLVVAVTSLHWINPLMLWIREEISRACELSCDEAVISGLSENERQLYGDTLLTFSAGSKLPAGIFATTLCEGKEQLKERLIHIMKYKKKSALAVALTCILALVLMGCAAALGVANNSVSGVENENTALRSALAQYESDRASAEGTGPFAAYVKDADMDTFDVYTQKDETYIMRLPWSLFDQFPASDRTDPNWEPGWMNVEVYCGAIDDFTWAVVCTGPAAGTGNANVCTSSDGGVTWWVGDKSAMYTGTVTGAGFASSKVGFMSYRYFFDQGPEISRTLDGGKTWERMTVDIPDSLKQYKMTPLVPAFTGESGIYPIALYDSDANYSSIAYLATKDGGMTWQWESVSASTDSESATIGPNNVKTTPEPVSKSDWIWPVEGCNTITSPFGKRFHPISGTTTHSDHITISGDNAEGAKVYAALAGTVSETGFDTEQGNYIVITHDNGIETSYYHLKEISVSEGDPVAAGDAIGTVGKTGTATGPCLGFCVYVNGVAVNPLDYF